MTDAGSPRDSAYGATSQSESEATSLDEQPPRLKYQRLGASVPELLRSDVALCMAVHARFLVLGTAAGAVCVLDFNGNAIKLLDSHAGPVRDVCVEDGGEYVASCGDDGRVMVHPMYQDGGDVVRVTYPVGVRSLALDPGYERRKTRTLVTGMISGKLTMNAKGFFGRKDTVLFESNGRVQTVRWRGNLIAWATESLIHIYDTALARCISFIERPKDPSPLTQFASPVRASLVWESDTSLLIAWADVIQIAVVRDASAAALMTGSPARVAEIQAVIRPDFLVAGIAPYDDMLVVLAYVFDDDDDDDDDEDDDADDGGDNDHDNDPSSAAARRRDRADMLSARTASTGSLATSAAAVGMLPRRPARPELRLWQRTAPYTELACDALGIRQYDVNACDQYRLELMPDADADEALFYIVSPRDIVVARPTGPDDRVDWLVQRERFEDALLLAEQHRALLRHTSVESVGEHYLHALVAAAAMDAAAALLPRVCRASRELWERWVGVFVAQDALPALCKHIPTSEPQLSRDTYTSVLRRLVSSHPSLLADLLRHWPHYLYDVPSLITDTLAASQSGGDPALLDALALLYSYDKQLDKALHIYLRLQRPAVFDLIDKHDLLASVGDQAAALMRIDASQATPLLVAHSDLFPVPQVVAQLQALRDSEAGGSSSSRELLHAYLDALFDADPTLGRDFHHLQVELYARYNYPKLRTFLESSNFVPLREAYDVCERYQLYPEMVYLLDRMGSARDALRLIMDKLHDVKGAIAFVHRHHDDSLWQDLMAHAMASPDFIAELLDNLGSEVNPLHVLKRIPDHMRIPDLRNRIVAILSDCQLEISLRAGCNRVLAADADVLTHSLVRAQRRALRVPSEAACSLCSRSVLHSEVSVDESLGERTPLVVFHCTHVYHERCLRASYLHTVSPYQHGLTSSNLALQQRGAVSSSPQPGRKSAASSPRGSIKRSVSSVSVASASASESSGTGTSDASGARRTGIDSKHKLWCPLCHASASHGMTQSFSWRRGLAASSSD